MKIGVIEEKGMDGKYKVFGRHVYGELYECNPNYLSDIEYLINTVREAVYRSNYTLLDIKAWKINPGVSVVAVILESHIAIHTWPEYSFATVDVYTCGLKGDPFKAFMYIVEKLEPKRYSVKFSDRSMKWD
ncbi:MAG: adenosylmethionine decarboxylase [Desulfurococcaceae archaeon]